MKKCGLKTLPGRLVGLMTVYRALSGGGWVLDAVKDQARRAFR